MTARDQDRWEQTHAVESGDVEPSSFLVEVLERGTWPVRIGKALDVACGKGRNALYLARRGFQVEALDVSDTALAQARTVAQRQGLDIRFVQTDLDGWEFSESSCDLVVNVNFLDRSLIPKFKRSLRVGGHVVFETFLIDQRVLGHPRNPAYLLGHNELLRLFQDFRVLLYREGKFSEGGREAFKAALLGQKIS